MILRRSPFSVGICGRTDFEVQIDKEDICPKNNIAEIKSYFIMEAKNDHVIFAKFVYFLMENL